MREERPPSGWRPEGLRPSNPLRPRGGGGGASRRRGRGRRPVHHRVHGWRHLPHRCTLARRGRGGKAAAGGGGAGPAEANPPGGARGGVGQPPATQTPESGCTLEPCCSSAFRCEGRGTSSPTGHPHLRGPEPPPRPSFAGGSGATVAGKRAPPLPPLLYPPLTRHPFFHFLR